MDRVKLKAPLVLKFELDIVKFDETICSEICCVYCTHYTTICVDSVCVNIAICTEILNLIRLSEIIALKINNRY